MDGDEMIKFEFKQAKIALILVSFVVFLSVLTFFEVTLITSIFLNTTLKNLLLAVILGFYLVLLYRAFFWILSGREQILITKDQLTILKKGTFLVTPTVYDLYKIENIRFEKRKFYFFEFLVSRTALTSLQSFGGIIIFDYQNKTVIFGGNMNENIGDLIVNKLKSHSLAGL